MKDLEVKYLAFTLMLCAMLSSCSNKGPLSIFNKLSPHDAYGQRLKDAGLDRTAMGSAWLQNAQSSLGNALNVSIPYKETGYFSAERIPSSTLRFDAKRGQKLHITLSKKPKVNFAIYIDLWQENTQANHELLASADTAGLTLDYEIREDAKYLLRLQPELLRSGEYTLTITAGPSLSFPVSSSGKPSIGSFWGDGRDEGGRKHEGIDIFATKHTPAIASANGTVTSVRENTLGGLVVFMRPQDRDYVLYYAHLDKQLVQDGQTVRTGDTLGLVGNTGNARTTPSHLHFGIYTNSGAINPLAFVDRSIKTPKPITASLELLNTSVRTSNRDSKLLIEPAEKALLMQTLPIGTALSIDAATDGWYKARLPDGTTGYIKRSNISVTSTMRKLTLKQQQPLLDTPDSSTAACKTVLDAGSQLNIKALYKNFYLVTDDRDNSGWIEISSSK